MEYGPAVQTSIGSISLYDLQHTCKNGEFVELFSVTSNCLVQESINLLYRKVLMINTLCIIIISLLSYIFLFYII
jgi:hypothetical protein